MAHCVDLRRVQRRLAMNAPQRHKTAAALVHTSRATKHRHPSTPLHAPVVGLMTAGFLTFQKRPVEGLLVRCASRSRKRGVSLATKPFPWGLSGPSGRASKLTCVGGGNEQSAGVAKFSWCGKIQLVWQNSAGVAKFSRCGKIQLVWQNSAGVAKSLGPAFSAGAANKP